MAGQSINDRLTAARYSLAGQGLAKSVCKSTTEEVIGPKKKHLDYLLHCTNEPNVSIPQLANLLIERSQQQSWVTVFKALITVHHMMCYGNQRFTQYLASSNCNFNLGGFLDKTGSADQPQLSYDMSTFIRRYAKYINEKAISYRGVAFDFCKTKRGKDDGTLRLMPTDTLLKTLPILQAQVDALLDFDCTAGELNNGVISSAFLLLFRDLIRLFACYNDGIINLLEKYFEMNKKQARDALDCYKKFLIRMDRVSEFLKVAETMGMDKSEIPDLKQAPSSLLDALESHLASLEGKKVTTATGAASSGVNLKNAVSALDSTSSSFGLACSNGRVETLPTNGVNGGGNMDEFTKRAALAEEEAMYEKLKTEHGRNNPFLSSPSNEPTPAASSVTPTGTVPQIMDFFGAPAADAGSAAQTTSKASDDLLQLGNPFAGVTPAPPVPQPMAQLYTNGFSTTTTTSFVSENSFAAVFGNTNNTMTTSTAVGQSEPEANPFADMAGLSSLTSNEMLVNTGVAHTAPGTNQSEDILKPDGSIAAPVAAPGPVPASSQSQKLISSDLDMSLSSLVDNLNIKGPTQKPQWNSPKTQSKTGGTGWTPSMTASTTAAYRAPAPMAAPQPQWNQPGMTAFQSPPVGIMAQGGTVPGSFKPAPEGSAATAFDPFSGL